MEKILVTGATGNTGSILVPALLNAGHHVRAFVRNTEKAQTFKDAGAEIYEGDLDKKDTILGALDDIDKIYLCTWNGPTASTQGRNIIEAIIESGVNPFVVRHSAFGPEESILIQQINEVDDALKKSDLQWTILKPTFYMQNLIMAAPTIKNGGQIYWDWDEGKVGMIDVRDVAASAFAALNGKPQAGKEYILTGPQAISMHEVAASFSQILDKKISYYPVPHDASKESMLKMGFPEFIVDGYVQLNHGFSKNFANTTTDNVKLLTGKAPKPISTFISDFKSYFE